MSISAVTKVTVQSGSFSAGKTVAAISISSQATMAYATKTLKILRLLSSPQKEVIWVPQIVWGDFTCLSSGQQLISR